jgi:hypothetical protein
VVRRARGAAAPARQIKGCHSFSSRRILIPLAALFGSFLMNFRRPGGDIGRHVAPLAQFKA